MLLKRVTAYIQTHALLERGMTLVVGVSGGPDSITLLHLLTQLRAGYGLTLIAAHLDHGLRSESGREADFVARTAAAWGVDCVVERADVRALAGAGRLSLEDAGRQARYEFFARLGPAAAVGHHADDQAETVLMHLLRGAGLAGMRGMLPASRQRTAAGISLTVLRPLLAASRAEIDAYLAEHGLESAADPTNADTTFLRNRIRHELIPLLETYNPNIRETLRRTADSVAGDYGLLADLIERSWNETRLDRATNDTVAFHLTRWRALPLAMQRALLRESAARLRPALRDVDFTPIDEAARWSQTAGSGHTADLLGGLCVSIVGDALRVGAWPEDGERSSAIGDPSPLPLQTPGETRFGEYAFSASRPEPAALADLKASADPWTVCLDAALGPFTLRARRAGDRFQPLGMGGTMKLSDFMINEKIPVDRRDAWPLLCCGPDAETVLWVAGHRLSERARVGEGTAAVVRVRGGQRIAPSGQLG